MRRTRAFTLIELLLVIAIIALLISILIPALAGARKSARGGICAANMRMFCTGFQSYAGDATGFMASFSWQPAKPTPSEYADNLIVPHDSVEAHARQAIEYARKLSGDATILKPTSVADHRVLARNFTQMVLIYGGYYGERNPEPAAACSEDVETRRWQALTPAQAATELVGFDYGAPAAFLPYYSSYQIIPNAFQDEKGPGRASHSPTDYRLYNVPSVGRFTQRRLDQVAFPSQKVVWFDIFDRHSYKRPIYYAYRQARQPLAFFDGSVRVMATQHANLGWQHNNQHPGAAPAMVEYRAINPLDPLPLYTSAALNTLPSYFRWTRQGIKGIDFMGKEVLR